MPMSPDDFPLMSMGNLIYGRMQSSPVLTANDSATANLVVQLLNERHEMQKQFIQNGGEPLALAFSPNGAMIGTLIH